MDAVQGMHPDHTPDPREVPSPGLLYHQATGALSRLDH